MPRRRKRIEADRKLARDARAEERRKERSSRRAEQERELNAYARERWQSSYDFLWTNRGDLPGPALLAGLEALSILATTNQQVQMLKVLTMGINTEAQEQIG